MCGENVLIYHGLFMFLGSPPRVRGKPTMRKHYPQVLRITPACAGKTVELFEFGNAPEDHPRVCGENFTIRGVGTHYRGSPPRVRGKRPNGTNRNDERRITPACAGKTEMLYNAKDIC